MRVIATCTLILLFLIASAAEAVEYYGFGSSGKVNEIKGQFIVRFADNTNLREVVSGFGLHRIGIPSVEKILDDAAAENIRPIVSSGTAVSSMLERIYVINIPREADDAAFIAQMMADPNVISIENDVECQITVSPNDPEYWRQWHLYQASRMDVHAQEAWEVETGSDTVILAIIDTGVNFRHPDLRNNIWVNPGEDIDGDYIVFDSSDFNDLDDDLNGYFDDVVGYDFFTGGSSTPWPGEDAGGKDNDPNDFNGHGTHCAGIAASVTNNGVGAAGMAGGWGPAWRDRGVQIMCLRAGYSAPHPDYGYETGFVVMSAVVEAINYAVNNGADVISFSAGSSNVAGMGTALTAVLDAGITFCHSAGNDGTDFPEPDDYFKNIIWLISVAWTDPDDTKNPSSNYGYWVEIAAPGSNIYSTYSYHYNPTYAYKSGTSMACPLVAGVAALLRSHYPGYDRSVIDTMMFNHADSIDDPYYHSGDLGAGRVNADSCLQYFAQAKFSGSPQVGPIPLTVDFTDESPSATSWNWTFGDGNSSGDQNPQHEYTDPGLYTVALEVTDPKGTHTEVKKFFVLASADTLGGDSARGGVNQSFPVEVSMANMVALDTIDVVFAFPEETSIQLSFDSVTTDETRGENFKEATVVDQGTGVVAIRCIGWDNSATSHDPLLPGSGPFVKLWFKGQVSGSDYLTLTTSGPWSTFVWNRYHDYSPEFLPVKVMIGWRGDANGDGTVNIADAVVLGNVVFRQIPSPPLYQGDVNGDGNINIGDVVYLVNLVFHDGPPPPP